MRECVVCGIEFDPRSPQKKAAGGLITNCPDCSEEVVAKHAGVTAGEGKMNAIQILQFKSSDDREVYMHFWKVNSGLFQGKSCQMGKLAKTPNVKYKTRNTFSGNANHKGKD